jgi:ABC-type transporter Mla subunit MlaD
MTGADVTKIDKARQAAGLNTLTEDQKTTLMTDASTLQGEELTAHLAKYKKIIAEINKELDVAKQKMVTLPEVLNKYKQTSNSIGQALQSANWDADSQDVVNKTTAAFNSLSKETQELM